MLHQKDEQSVINIILKKGFAKRYRTVESEPSCLVMHMFPKNDIDLFNAEFKDKKVVGVYILYSDGIVTTSKNGKHQMFYIGESENVAERLRNHAKNEEKCEFWESTLVIRSTKNNFSKGLIRYLEALLIQKARKTENLLISALPDEEGYVVDENIATNNVDAYIPHPVNKSQTGDSATETETISSKSYLKEIVKLISVVGLPFFDMPEFENSTVDSELPSFTLKQMKNKSSDLSGEVIYDPNKERPFILLAGAHVSKTDARDDESKKQILSDKICRIRDECKEKGFFKDIDGDSSVWELLVNYPFEKVTQPSSFIVGYSTPSRIWKEKNSGMPFDEWIDKKLDND